MMRFLLPLHVTAASLVIGSLFVQSLMVVMALRLKLPEHREGVRILQRRLHLFIYYPILLVALVTGLWMALLGDAFAEGRWLHWKLVWIVVLIGLGFMTGRNLRQQEVLKPVAMVVHIVIFLVSMAIVYLAALKPF